MLRTEVGRRPRDAALAREIGESREHSPVFRRFRDEQAVLEQAHATLLLGSPGPTAIPVYTAVPGLDSESAPHRLARAVAPSGEYDSSGAASSMRRWM
ncbi:hypothetical protein [Kitasatospora sp. NPDC096204]|uniref:MmyB family transcriptional regulator n=1 Tax=Kitasatospora sp. NPDC096204 TaxID=3364094 RepID=UPI003823C383